MTSSPPRPITARPVPRALPPPDVASSVTPPGFRTPVRGHAFAARPPDVVVAPGDTVRLVREPDNPRDPRAVAVWIEGTATWRAGYLDRVVAARLAPRLDDGQRWAAVVAGWVDAPGGWQRPLVQLTTAATGHDVRDPAGGLWGRPPGSRRRVVARRSAEHGLDRQQRAVG